jgi:hypothetical protein
VLGHQQEGAVHVDQGARHRFTVGLQPLPHGGPGLEQVAVAGDLGRVAAGTEQPRVTDLGRDHGQVHHRAGGRQCPGEGVEGGGPHVGAGEPLAQRGVGGDHVVDRGRTQVVAGVQEGEHLVAAGHGHGAAIATGLVGHHQLGTVGRPPAEHRGHVGHRPGRVHPQVQEGHAGLGQQRHQAPAVAGHIGHLGGHRAGGGVGAAEAVVELGGDAEAGAHQVGVHQLGVGGDRQGVPGQVAALDARRHGRPPARVGVGEGPVQDPRAGGPHQPVGASGTTAAAQLGGHGQRSGEEVGEVPVLDLGGQCREPEVQVVLATTCTTDSPEPATLSEESVAGATSAPNHSLAHPSTRPPHRWGR